MSQWTHINGTITVSPMGRTQPEKRYVLDTVLSHLPKVTGSEENMNIHVIQKARYDCSSSHDELGQLSNLGDESKGRPHPSFRTQSSYIIVIEGALRDRSLNRTVREFTNWLCRLAKRVHVTDILVRVSDSWEPQDYLFKDAEYWYGLFEDPSWTNDTGEPNWCEYLMWDRAKESTFPIELAYKYYSDPENDREAEHRLNYLKDEWERGK